MKRSIFRNKTVLARLLFLCMPALLLLTSCSKKEDCCVNIDTFVDVLYRSGNVHLFGPDGGAFTESDVKVEYLIESDWTSPNAVRGADPRSFKLLHDDVLDAYVLRVFPEFEVSGNKRSVRITIGHFEPDVIEVETHRSGASEVATKVWLNGDLRWDTTWGDQNEFQGRRMFSVDKVSD